MKTIFWNENGPLVQFNGEFLHIEDLNPHFETKWRVSRWELFIIGIRAAVAALTAFERADK